MNGFRRTPLGSLVALVLGLAIGVRAIQVVDQYALAPQTLDPSSGTAFGFAVTAGLVFGLAIWARLVSPNGMAWPRFTALGVGMLLGGLIGWAAFSAAHVSPWLASQAGLS